MPPLSVLIKPASGRCNMRCAYCFYADVAQHRVQENFEMMSPETLEILIRKALAFAEGSCTFMFQGGEPTLAGLPFFEKAVTLQKQYNVKKLKVQNAIQTNGLVLDAAWAEFLAKNHFLVGLSLDGDGELHNMLRPDAKGKGTYARVTQAADRLKKAGCDVNILCVVTKDVARHGARVYSALKRYGYLQFIPCIDSFDGAGEYGLNAALYGKFLHTVFQAYYQDFLQGKYVSERTFDNWVYMLRGLPPENCAMNGVCSCNLVVEGDGGVYPCDFYVLDAWHLGNIRKDAVADLMSVPRAAEFVQNSREVAEECKSCRYRALCRGGCRRDRLDGKNRFCAAYCTFFDQHMNDLTDMARRVYV